jgi:ubiquinone/menaquinone biosynthesis C-methylase UbiE
MTPFSELRLNTPPAICDRYFAPAVLLPFADDMAHRLARLSIGPLLEIAAGTGILTQAMASALSAGLTIIATDADAEMIKHASAKSGMARVTWQRADPDALPFPDATFGIVACHFGVAAMPDRVRTFQEVRRVMKPGGRFVFSVLGALHHNPVAECLQNALEAFVLGDPPQYIVHCLHGYADNEAIDDDLTTAGFTEAIYTTVELPFAAASAADVAAGYCLGTPLRMELEARTGGDIEPILQAVTQALQKRFGPGAINAPMRGHIISAAG